MRNTLVAINDIRSGIEAGKNAREIQGQALYDNTNLVRALLLYQTIRVNTGNGLTGIIGSKGQEYGTTWTDMSSINNTGSAGGGTLKQALESAFRISEVFFKKIVINNLKVAIANNGTILIPETVISSLLTLYENGSFKTISPIVVGQTTVSFTDNTTYYAINIKDSDNSDQAELRFYYNDNYEITEIQFWGYGGSSSNEYRAFEFDLTIEGILKSDSVPSLSDLQSFINFIDVLKTEFTNLPTYLE